MPKLTWDDAGKKLYETGVDRGVLYIPTDGVYTKGVAWNGLISVTESPSGAEPSPLYANNGKYAVLMSNEEFGGTIEAYTYPDEFAACNGEALLADGLDGISVAQQSRQPFGFAYRTLIGNDEKGTEYGYKIHLVYGALAAVAERANTTVNDSPEAMTMSWEFSTTPVKIAGMKPTSHVIIDSTKVTPENLAKIEKDLYGDTAAEAKLPLPDELITLLGEG